MPKKIKFESFRYRFLVAAQGAAYRPRDSHSPSWKEFIRGLNFAYESGEIAISWEMGHPNSLSVPLSTAKFCIRGDSEVRAARQQELGLMDDEDPVKLENGLYFARVVSSVAQLAGYQLAERNMRTSIQTRHESERDFHDAWAESEDIESIDVRAANEACTAPEMRYITERLGDIRGKRLLDIGCGLGEASVYFAMRGADVTSSDLSQGMLDATSRLAEANRVNVVPHLAAAEDLHLPADAQFDIIYMGNLLHHVDIDRTLARVKPHLVQGGTLVTWDPLAYNPAINVYRSIATDVRTPDEHPLKWRDMRTFRRHFDTVETRYFWLTTLAIFVIMAVAQGRNPNKERFWKVVVQEGDKWRWLYAPLERLDSLLLYLVPPLRLLCWNVVVLAKTKAV